MRSLPCSLPEDDASVDTEGEREKGLIMSCYEQMCSRSCIVFRL